MQLYSLGEGGLHSRPGFSNPLAKSGPLFVLQNKFLLAFSHAFLFPYCLWLLIHCSGRDHKACKALIFTSTMWPFSRETLLTLISCGNLSPSASVTYSKYLYQIRIWVFSCAKQSWIYQPETLSLSLLFFFFNT